MKEMVGGCCVCSDDRGWPENPLVYCDGQFCTVAVHQACYGIVTVPTGPWYCRKCESQERSVKVKCELCPSKYGALKRTDNSGWAHVVCALYIPEVRFGNVTTMEPIQLQLIPAERFNKVCYICEENGKGANGAVGACMQCNKAGCKQQFHVTCAQSLGLLCEEAGNYFDNVKYCGYCQHHYSKLKKGGHVKTIPPYKPVSGENQQSDSDKEGEASKSSTGSQAKRKTATSKGAASKVTSATKPSTSYQKQPAPNKVSDKVTKTNTNIKSAKSVDESVTVESDKTEKKEPETDKEVRDNIKSKKRKANSRTPTPSIISEANTSVPTEVSTTNVIAKKESPPQNNEVSDKVKKAKTDILPTPLILNKSLPTTTASSTTTVTALVIETPVITQVIAPPIIQTNQLQLTSVVVSVPLQTALSPNNKQEILPLTANRPAAKEEESNSQLGVSSSELVESTPMITSEMSGGGLKIAYESQSNATKMELDEEVPQTSNQDVPAKRSRSQSTEKIEKATRSKKKNSNGVLQNVNMAPAKPKRSSRSQHNTPPPQINPFVNIPQGNQVKDSPPSSPSSESLGAPPTLGRKKGRKSAPATISDASSSSQNKDTKENIKLIQNGINAPHMLGNQLNLNSNMAQKMTDHLNSELEAHSIFSPGENSSNLVGPQLHHRVIASARSSSTGGSSTASAGSGLSSMLGGNGAAIPQTLDQLLERQWEQGSQFLMEQAQHFDIASLLSCLHQLRAENLRLEEHVSSLLQRRDHLLAVNARLAIPLTSAPAAPQSSHPHTVNNIHPSVAANHADPHRSRHSNPYPHMQGAGHPANPIENGLSPEGYPNSHRSPATSQPQPSPNLSGFSNNGVVRQPSDSSGRSAPRPHSYGMYQSSSSNQPQQGVMRRDGDPHHPGSSKLS